MTSVQILTRWSGCSLRLSSPSVDLSQVALTSIYIPHVATFRGQTHDLVAEVTRAQFDELTRPLVERCRNPVDRAIKDAGIAMDGISAIVAVGGASRIPSVRDLLAGWRRPLLTRVDPEVVVAAGAAIGAGVLLGQIKDVLLMDTLPFALGFEVDGGTTCVLIEQNTTIPMKRTEVFTIGTDNQSEVDVRLLAFHPASSDLNRSPSPGWTTYPRLPAVSLRSR